MVAIVSLLAITALTWAAPQGQNSAKRHLSSGNTAFLEAEQLFAQGRTAEAEAKTLEQLKLHPSSVQGYNLLGVIYSSGKDYAHALDAFQQGLRIDPNSTRVHNNLANLYASQGKADLAEKEFRKVLRFAPANRDANYNLGLLLMAKGSPGEAIACLGRVRPQDEATRFNLVRAYLQAGKFAEGLKAAQALSAEKQSNVQLHFSLGVLLAEEKQYPAAEEELEKANALEPETFEILYNLGQAYLRGGQYGKAELVLGRALRLKPESPETLYRLAQVYSEQSRPVDALELLVRAHKLAPEDTDIVFLMARVSMSQNYFEDAIPLLESGLKLAGKRADLHAALGESYFMSGKTEKAIQEFGRLIELEPSARSYAFMGLAYRHLGRFEEARKYFEEGRRRDPRNPACLFNLGFIEERQGNGARAEELFQQALRSSPDFADALLELANLRTKDKKFAEAAELLRRYVKSSRDPASGYYKLAMIERSLHQTAAAQRDLNVFQTLSKNSSTGPYPYQHLFDYLDNRSSLSSAERNQLDVSELTEQIKKHPGQPQDLYLLAEAYLKLGKKNEALEAIAQLDQISAGDYRTQTGTGVLLARYRLYQDAIQHFRAALGANPDSDDVKFDLADAYFRQGLYPQALEAAAQVSANGQLDDSYLALLGDIYAHLGNQARSMEIFQDAIRRNPDNDQYYLSLTLVELRANDITGAEQTLKKGLARVPASGKILWGLGLVAVLRGNAQEAADRLERAVELLPEWAGSYSTLGIFYYETGQIDKAREVLSRFKGANVGGLDVGRIEETLSRASGAPTGPRGTIPVMARQQVLQLALAIADRTL
ncbi:MAG: tetratricopeptide repeat protein [Acidobacteria bacterium]|nr:tetratricopeptide repeat protein [Acidobacteriota bacterium]